MKRQTARRGVLTFLEAVGVSGASMVVCSPYIVGRSVSDGIVSSRRGECQEGWLTVQEMGRCRAMRESVAGNGAV